MTSSIRPGWTSMPSRRRMRPKASRLSRSWDIPSLASGLRAASRDRPIEQLGGARSANRFQIFFRLQHDSERVIDHSGVERVRVEGDKRGYPVDGLRHAGHLVEVFGAQLLHHRGHLVGQPRRCLGSALANDRHFLLERWIFNPLIQASAFERVVHLTRAVRCENHERWLARPHGPELGNGDLKFGEQLQEKSFELLVGPIDFVDQQDGRTRTMRIDRLQQRTLDEKSVAVEIPPRALPIERARRLENAQFQELACVVPFVQSVSDIEPLIALKAYEISSE